MSSLDFASDPKVQHAAEAHAAQAVRTASERFGMELDWSDESIERLESILQKIHVEVLKVSPSADRIHKLATAYGCYLGEVLRRNHSGTWGTVKSADGKSWALEVGIALVAPVDEVRKRLSLGPQENVQQKFQTVVSVLAHVAESSKVLQSLTRSGKSELSAFAADDNIQNVAEAYSLDAVDFAKATFRIRLDWTDQSIERLEEVLTRLHRDIPKSKPTEEQIFGMAKMFGSYIGEVFRRNHGGQWGIVNMAGQRFPGMQHKAAGLFWPWGKANNRLVNGPGDNVAHYYQVLLEKSRA